jgi:benzoyl-CoA reductase/2-hydroxyglutaryl-CoA dehydratase subunit BcrC/BadD/HgdB
MMTKLMYGIDAGHIKRQMSPVFLLHNRTHMQKVNITHLNNRHNDWLRAIDFYHQELNILKERLTEIAGKNTGLEMLKEVEHYENQLSIQANNLDHLRHSIKENVNTISKQVMNAGAGYIDGELMAQHDRLEQMYAQQEQTINKIRQEFSRFSAIWM